MIVRLCLVFFVLLNSNKNGECQVADDRKLDSLISTVNNRNITWVVERDGSSFTPERAIVIESPEAAIEIVKIGSAAVYRLLENYDDPDRDWAIYLMLTAIFNDEPRLVVYYHRHRDIWRQGKSQDSIYFRSKIPQK